MTAIYDVDFSAFCGRIGNLYVRNSLCPPFALRHAAESWIAKGIPLSHCLDMIERYLSRHAGSCYSGSGDRDFAWLNGRIHAGWHEQQVSPQRAQSSRSEVPACGGTDQALPQREKSIGQTRKQPNRFDEAIAFLRRELAHGEVAATLLEQKAQSEGISTRTLDRARARLKVISRRTGFAKEGKCWCSLPMTP